MKVPVNGNQMFRFLYAATVLLIVSTAMVAFDFDREQRAAPGLTAAAYAEHLGTRLMATVHSARAQSDYSLSRMPDTLGDIERTPGGAKSTKYLATLNQTVHGSKVAPRVGIGMCRQEGGRKTCSPFAH
ncbi:MAG: hypothetical protein RIT14_1071 [Pseudomonadota bacterium]